MLSFCRKRGISTDGIRIVQRTHPNLVTGLIEKIDLEIQVTTSFPKEYYTALIRSAELGKVKKTLEQPPRFEVVTREVEIA